jgi:tetratricopeptide (TPR) repeat protein
VQKARDSSDPGFYLNANACADAVLALSPGNRLAENLRGFSLLNDHRFREARELETQLLAQNADDPTAYGTLSDAELELGDVTAAEHAAQRMLDLKPSLASYSRGAYLRWLHGDLAATKRLGAQAIRAGREAKDKEPLAWVLVQAALVFWNEGDYDGAQAGFALALTDSPGYAPALVGEGRVALAAGHYAAAATSFEQAFAKAPLVETAWLLGDAKRLAGDTAGADKAYATVVSRGRLHDPRTLSSFLSSHHGDAAEAVRLARAEYAERPGPYTTDALAWALYRAGSYAEARALSDVVVALGVRDARILYHAGAIRVANGDASGKKLVRRALALNPAFDVVEAEEARQLVAHDV